MLAELPEKSIGTIQDAARRLTGAARRKFEAAVAIDYCQGSPRRTESVFGWGPTTVKAGLDQLQTGVARLDQFFKRGRRKTEENVSSTVESIGLPIATRRKRPSLTKRSRKQTLSSPTSGVLTTEVPEKRSACQYRSMGRPRSRLVNSPEGEDHVARRLARPAITTCKRRPSSCRLASWKWTAVSYSWCSAD